MDNLAHALTGAALGYAGLRRQSGLAVATLVIAANLPDIDIVSAFAGRSLAWRRGWTHGPLGLLVLPLLLVAVMIVFDRWQAGRGSRPPTRPPVRAQGLLLLAYVAILTHPLLDLMNAYGVRLLMPFSERWFYGDALFIIDIWVWITLALGIGAAARRAKRGRAHAGRPAAVGLVVTAAYCIAMTAASVAAERYVRRAVAGRGLPTPDLVVANPVPIDPFRRRIVFAAGDALGVGELRWTPSPRLRLDPQLVPTNMHDSAIARAAARDRRVADFLYWARLPFAQIERTGGITRVTIGDARYNSTPGRGVFTVRSAVE